MKTVKITPIRKNLLLLLVLVQLYYFSTAQVTGIYTDYNGFWKSSTTSVNPVLPNNSNNVLAFTYNSETFSTGVDDGLLTTKGVTYTPANFKALPVTSIGSTVASSTYIALGTLYDGVNNGFSSPLPSVRMIDVLTDGINGLDIGTGVTNIPAAAAITFPVNNIDVNSINDSKPDILFSQTAQPTGAGDKLYFVDKMGTMVGNSVSVTWTAVPVLGSYTCDLYNLSSTICDAAVITSGSLTNQLKDIRLIGLQLSEFNLTAANSVNVVSLVIKPGGQSDPAFVAYNLDAMTIPSPVITIQPHTTVTCPESNNDATFSVTASGFGLSYQWLKDGVAIPGATSSTYTIVNVKASDAGKYEVAVSNDGGTVISSVAYLNTSITVQPSPVSQTIATGNQVTLSVTATNATSYQWKRNGVDIDGATLPLYMINPLTTTNDGTFSVNVINSALNGCASLLSNPVSVTASTVLYSKSSGNLNLPSSWGVNTNGTGSTPLNFGREEHIFKVANRANAFTGGDITIAGTLDLMDAITSITAGTTLKAARIIRSGTTGTIAGTNTSNLIVNGTSDLYFTTGSQVLKNLTIEGGTTSLNTPLSISGGITPGIVTVSAGTLSTLDNLTLKSDEGGTSSVGISRGAITGAVTVERYINIGSGPGQHVKSWQFLSIPTVGQSIKESWMEDGSVLSTGYGTQITGPGGVNAGFDAATSSPSIKTYNWATDSWTGVTNANNVIYNPKGYMVFVRGDRSVTYNQPANSTTLRTKGTLLTGSLSPISVIPGKWESVGNPYASPVDFSLITKDAGIDDKFYVWDPYLYGTYGLGGYQTLSSANNWEPVPGGTATYKTGVPSKVIQSGQAFSVHATPVTPAAYTLTFTENCKAGNSSSFNFARMQDQGATVSQKQFFRTSLFTGPDGIIADGNIVAFDRSFSDNLDGNDALKMINSGENFGLKRDGQLLSIEAKGPVSSSDTIYYNMSNLKARTYQLRFASVNMDRSGLEAYLVDQFLKTSTLISLTDSSFVNIEITSNAASSAANRFKVVFKTMTVLPVTITSVKAYAKEKNIAVEWKVENESNMLEYEVEKSADGSEYVLSSAVPALNHGTGKYVWIDQQIVAGNNYYRIKVKSQDGASRYTEVVKVSQKATEKAISVYPNPIVNNTINLMLTTQPSGTYGVRLLNSLGEIIMIKNISHAGGTKLEKIEKTGNDLPKGIYQLEVNKPNGNQEIIKILK